MYIQTIENATQYRIDNIYVVGPFELFFNNLSNFFCIFFIYLCYIRVPIHVSVNVLIKNVKIILIVFRL